MLADFYFNLPLFSAILLLIAGVLIGYALWLPFRNDADAIQDQLGDLRLQNDDLHDALQQGRDAYARLERKHTMQCDELTALRATTRSMEEALREHGCGVQSMEDIKTATLQALDDQRRERQSMEAELRRSYQDSQLVSETIRREHAALQEQLLGSENQGQQLKSLQEEYQQLQGKYASLVSEVENTKRHHADTVRQCEQLQVQLRNGEGEIDRSNKALSDANETVETLRMELHDLQAAQAESCANEHDHEAQLTRSLEQLKLAEVRIEELRQLFEQQKSNTHGLQRHVSQLEAELAAAQEKLLNREHDGDQLQMERDLACASQQSTEDKMAAAQEDLQHHRRALEVVDRQKLKAEQQLRVLHVDHDHLKETVKRHEHTIETLRGETDTQHQQIVAARQTIQRQTVELESVRSESNSLSDELMHVKNQLQEIESRSLSFEGDIDRVRGDREQLLDSLHREKDRSKELARCLAEQTRRLESVSLELNAAQLANDNAQDMRVSASELEQQIQLLQDQRTQSGIRIAELEQAHTTLESRLSAMQRDLLNVERERDEFAARLRQRNVMLESQLAQQSVDVDATRIDERRGLIYVEPPQHHDDLKRISGVAAKLEQRLNEFGIYTYQQIMEWDPATVEEFSRLLTFPERIARDNWVGQARALFAEKYGDAA